MRRPDWPERLQALIDSRRRAAFCWGSHDCCLFARDAIEAVSGYRLPVPPYASERAAVRVLRDLGGFSAAVEAAGGSPQCRAFAQRGDAVLIEQAGTFGMALGVCVGVSALAAGPDGLVDAPADRWLRAWRI